MKKLLIFLGALAAYGTDCTISDTVRTPFGGYFAGRIVVALNSPGSAQPLYSGSQTLTGWQTTIEVPASANGAVAVTLVCTDTITPAGTSYSARYQPTSGSPWSETWNPTTGTTTIRAMRATTVPTPTTTFQASQIVPGSNGQVLTTTAGATAWGSVPACATCVVTSGSYADPAWITSLAASKLTGTTLPAGITTSSLTSIGTLSSLGVGAASPSAYQTFGGSSPNGYVTRYSKHGAHANSLGFNLTYAATLFDVGQPEDEVMNWGYNISPGGSRESANDTAISFSLEGSYNISGAQYTEAHLLYVDKTGTQKRPWSWRINKNNTADWVNLISASSTVWSNPTTGTNYFSLSPTGFELAAGSSNFLVTDAGDINISSTGAARGLNITTGWNIVQIPGIRAYPSATVFDQAAYATDRIYFGSGTDTSVSRFGAAAIQVGDGGLNANGTVRAASFVGALTGTATSLAANGTNCSSGSFPLGVDASGNSESCTAVPTTITGTANQITASASTGAVTLSLPATITGLTSVTSTGFTGALTGNASTATALASSLTSGYALYGQGTGIPAVDADFTRQSAGSWRLYGATVTTGLTKLIVRAGDGQSTTNLVEFQSSTGTVLGAINSSGRYEVLDAIYQGTIGGAGTIWSVVNGVASHRSDGAIRFANTTNATGTKDTAIGRFGVGKLELNSGTAIGTTPGNARDLVSRRLYTAEATSDPSASDLTIAGSNAEDVSAIYMKNDKLVIAYNRSGTVTYLTIPLDGATTSWTQSTSAP